MKNLLFLLLSIYIISCKKEIKKEEVKTAPVIEAINNKEKITSSKKEIIETKKQYSHKNTIQENVMVPFTPRFFKEVSDHHDLLGFYVGKFNALKYDADKKPSYSNKINISINHITKDSIFGHSVVAGNARPFRGIIDTTTFKAKVFEPGDDKYDGVFEFKLNPKYDNIEGVWIANDSMLAVSQRKYDLIKTVFKYKAQNNIDEYTDEWDFNLTLYNSQNPESGKLEGFHPGIIGKLNSSLQKLTNKDIENLSKGELEILRNMIYARHGYSFKNRRMRYFFDSEIDWYIPVSTDIRGQLTDLEKKNIALIKRYEQHAEKYYDYFGR